MNYSKIKKIDDESLQKLTEGPGPSDKCLCSLLSPPEEERKGIRASIKKAFASLGHGKKRRNIEAQQTVDVPLSLTKGFKNTKEVVKRKSSCGKCGCDSENVILKHSYANIRITSPDVSSFCSCPSNCMPDKDKFKNNINVTIERVQVLDVDSTDSEFSIFERKRDSAVSEPLLSHRGSFTSLVDECQYEDDACSVWSSGDEKDFK